MFYSMFYLVLSLVFLLLVFVCWYKYAYAPYQVFKRIGLPHPPVTPFFGNAFELLSQETLPMMLEKWIKNYGKVYGYYVGSAQSVVVADLDMIKEITVKQFDKFTDNLKEPTISAQLRKKLGCSPGLLFEKGEDWKRVRNIVSPTFSSKKLKLMIPLIHKSCNSLIDRLEEVSINNQSIDLNRLYGQFTMETILSTVFGSQVNILKGEGDSLTEAAGGVFEELNESTIVWNDVISSQFPKLTFIFGKIADLFQALNHEKRFIDSIKEIVQTRRQQIESGNEMRSDFLQLLINARAEDTDTSSKKTLTDAEIIGVSFDFMLAGYETTSTLLACTSYLLALNPDKQELLCEAIGNYYQENEDATLYDASHNIPYLDWVIQESLRLYPSAPITNRTCTETCTINGVTFLKGMNLDIALRYNQRSSEYWDEPDVFEPNRFSPEGKEGRNPLCHLPFGWGPRNCIGMRFALMKAKMALVCILKKYKFERGPDTQVPLKLRGSFGTQFPKDGVFLKIIKH